MNSPTAAPPYVSPPPVQGKVLRKLYLTLFLRGRSARGLQKSGVPTSVARKLAFSLLFYGLYGAFAFFFLRQNVLSLSIYLHGMTFLFLGMFVASSAGEVLFNKEEADILLHRPVTARAMLWSKISVMIQVSLWLAMALNLIGLFVGGRIGGWLYPVAHVLSTILESLFCTGLIVLTYQLCLRWFGRERLDGLMTTAQVFVSIFVILGGQILPRMMGGVTQATTLHLDSWWLGLLPPMWFASFDDALTGSGKLASWIFAVVGLIATTVVLAFAFGKLAQSYESGLQKLGENLPTKPKKLRRRWINALINLPPFRWWLGNPVERASFLLTTAYMIRDRDVKLRLYPGIAPMLIMPVIFLLQDRTGGRAGSGGFGIAFTGGFLGLIPMLAQNILQYSQQWHAADLFCIVPMTGPGSLCHGVRKAVLLFLTLPLLLLLGGVTLVLHVKLSQLALLLPGIFVIPVFALLPGLLGKDVPLSQPPEDAKAANRGAGMIVTMLIPLALAGVATWAWSQGWFQWLLLGEAIVVGLLYYVFKTRLSRATWDAME